MGLCIVCSFCNCLTCCKFMYLFYMSIFDTNVPIMKKAVNVIYDMSEDTKIREYARMREKALHDEATALKNAKAEGEANIIAKMKAYGMTDEQIKNIIGS